MYQVGSNKVADSNQPIKIALAFSKYDWSISNVSIVFLSGRSVSKSDWLISIYGRSVSHVM